jgi:monoamine oxidase
MRFRDRASRIVRADGHEDSATSSPSARYPDPMIERHEFVVVGAGLSGLCCARALSKAGRDVVVVEARDRVGGRTESRAIGATRLDVGGQWLGAKQPRLSTLAHSLGVETFDQHHKGAKVLRVRGKRSTYQGSIPALAPHRLAEMQLALFRLDRLLDKLRIDAPLEGPLADLDADSVETWTKQRVRSRTVRALLASAIRVIFGAELRDISMLYFLTYLRAGGGLMSLVEIEHGAQQKRFVGGAQTLSERAAAELSSRVHLSSPVRRIEQDEARVRVLTDSHTFTANRVVVAIPPPLVARIDFSPNLPSERDQLLYRAPMGSMVKCLITYDRAFWREDGLSGELVCDDDPVCVGFDATSHDGAQPALVAFVGGRPARAWGRRDAQERQSEVLAVLARAFGEQARRPSAFIEKDWSADPWSRGCPVSVLASGALSSCAEGFAKPVGRVHFAGTETAREWTGYLEGAIEAGERAAAEVLAGK